jgi:hypothetical protein
MKKTLITAVSAAALGIGGAIAAATPANALVWWVIPAIAGGVVGGAAISSTANNPPAYYAPAPAGNVYVRPAGAARCHIMRERVPGGYRRVEVCD